MDEETVSLVAGHAEVRLALPQHATDLVQGRIHRERRFYESDLLDHAATLLAPGDVVVDAGAYVGNHSLYFACVAGARVVAFEPQAAAVDVLRRNVELNGASDRVEVHERALGAAPARGRLTVASPRNLGDAVLEVVDAGAVEVLPLDAVPLPGPLRLLKIDVQGMELAVLRGAEATLRRDRPFLYVEATTAADLEAQLRFLAGLGYAPRGQFGATPTVHFASEEDPARRLSAQLALTTHLMHRSSAAVSGRLQALARRLRDPAVLAPEPELDRRDAGDEALAETLDRLLRSMEQSAAAQRRTLEGWAAERRERDRALLERMERLERRLDESVAGLRRSVADRPGIDPASLLSHLAPRLDALRQAVLPAVEQTARAGRAQVRGLQESVEGRLARLEAYLEEQTLHTRRVEAELVGLKARVQRRATRAPAPRPAARPSSWPPRPPWTEERAATARRKLRKLVRDPAAFLADARSPLLRTLGARLFPS